MGKSTKNQDQKPKTGLAALFASEMKLKVIGGIVAVIAGGIAAGLTGFLPDYGRIDRIASQRLIYGQPLTIDVGVEPRLWPLHDVHFVVADFGALLRPWQNSPTECVLPLVKEKSLLSRTVPKVPALEALAPGPAQTTVMLRLVSSRGRVVAQEKMTVDIVPHAKYDGEWRGQIAGRPGKFLLHPVPGISPNAQVVDVYGFFKPDQADSATGLVTGKFNGDRFVGYVTFGDMPARVSLNAVTRTTEDGRLLADGTCQLLAPIDGDWLPAGDEKPYSMSRDIS